MAKYLKKFENHAEYSAYSADTESYLRPNVSICVTENHVHYNVAFNHVDGVTLDKETWAINFEVSNSEAITTTLTPTITPSYATNKKVTWSSSDPTVATVDANGVVALTKLDGETIITVTTEDGGFTAQCKVVAHSYVVIGGKKWATVNVGGNKPTDYGLYYSWGDTQGYTGAQVGSGSGKKYFGWADYKYGNGTSSPGNTGMTKYNASDGKTTIEASDDAATVNMGAGWRIPTKTELQGELSAATTATYTSNYEGSGVAGLILTSKADSSKKLFFPAAGYCNDGNKNVVGNGGSYMTNSLFSAGSVPSYTAIWTMYFTNTSTSWVSTYFRYGGLAVRAILDE